MLPAIWTRQRVCEALVTAFRVVPGLTVYSSRRAIGASADVEAELNWRVRFLADDPDGWRYLMMWAERQAAGGSIEERRRALGWSHRRFQNGWRRAADAIAAGLNGEIGEREPSVARCPPT